MEVKLNVNITDFETIIKFVGNQNGIKISDASNFIASEQAIYFLYNETRLGYIGVEVDNYIEGEYGFNKVIAITVPSEINLEYLEYVFLQEAIKNEIPIINKEIFSDFKIPENQKNNVNDYKDKILFVLKNFGYNLFQLNSEPESKAIFAKPRHKWSKEISQIEFTIKLRGGEGKAVWQARDKLVLRSGAKLAPEPQLNKDGSMNFSAQFAEKLRMDYVGKMKNGVTTTDIIFKSPNQLGLFLLFGGQNTWAELKDKNGKSLDDWTRVE